MPYSTPGTPMRSRWGIAAVVMCVLSVPPLVVLMLPIAGYSLIAHDPQGDAGGPVIMLAHLVFTAVCGAIFGLCWLLSGIFALLGLIRTRCHCIWSRIASILLLLTLIGGTVGVILIWHFVR
jgi:hypothetical protein